MTTTKGQTMNLTEGGKMGNYTALLLDGYTVALRSPQGNVYEVCKRCGGEGQYSYNPLDGTVCYGCYGKRIGPATTEADVIRKAEARAKARARKAAKAEAEYAAKAAAMQTWQDANADLIEALRPHLAPVDDQGYADFGFRPVNTFLTDLAGQAIRGIRPLSERQVDAAKAALARQAQWDAEKAAKAAESAAAGHYGNVGDKVTAEVTIVGTRFFEGSYNRSASTLVTMRTDAGHILKTFSSGAFGWEAEKGQRVTITGTVKALDEYNGEPQTTLKNVKAV